MFHLSKQCCIDLGTANTSVLVLGEGIVMEEPSLVALDDMTHKVIGIGKTAQEMIGRTPAGVSIIHPIRQGVIADYAVTEALMRYIMQKALGRFTVFKPDVMLSVPAGSTQVERRAVLDAVMAAGARAAFLVDQPLAAIVGAGVSIAEAGGNMIVEIGAGTAECLVASLGGVVAKESVRTGSQAFDDAIKQYLKKTHTLLVSSRTAETVKIRVGTAIPLDTDESVVVRGRNTVDGLPKEVRVGANELVEPLSKTLREIAGMVKRVLSELPPELASDLIDRGVLLAGGGALLRNLDRYMTASVGVPVAVVEQPLRCVVLGMESIFGQIELYKRSLNYRG